MRSSMCKKAKIMCHGKLLKGLWWNKKIINAICTHFPFIFTR
jgi:hypothetical protein